MYIPQKFRLTFRPGNYTRRFPYGFGVVVRDLGEWRPGFYSEFRCASCEHSGLPWGAIFRKVLVLTQIQDSHVHFSRNKFPKWILPQMLQSERSMETHTNTIHNMYMYTHMYMYLNVSPCSLSGWDVWENQFWELVPGKMNMVILEIRPKHTFFKMAPQAKPLCS